MFDLEVLVPVSSVSNRLEDFKKCGLMNVAKRKVLVFVLVSGERIEGADAGWPDGVEVRVVEEESPNYVANIYGHYLKMDSSSPRARWFIRLDDDSCTDVEGLLANLDSFYCWEQPYHLGELNNFSCAKAGAEGRLYNDYRNLLGRFDIVSDLLKNEVECGITSAAGLSKVLSNAKSLALLRKRATLDGGFGDCVFALAAAMAGVYPVDCPFVTHMPLLREFSIFGGVKNHIHKISRVPEGQNFGGRVSREGFELIMKVATGSPSEIEASLIGKRFLLEEERSVKIVKFKEDYAAAFKMDGRSYHWLECEGSIVILSGSDTVHRIPIENGSLVSSPSLGVSKI